MGIVGSIPRESDPPRPLASERVEEARSSKPSENTKKTHVGEPGSLSCWRVGVRSRSLHAFIYGLVPKFYMYNYPFCMIFSRTDLRKIVSGAKFDAKSDFDLCFGVAPPKYIKNEIQASNRLQNSII